MASSPIRSIAWLSLATTLACSPEGPPPELPGMRLLERAEVHLQREAATLRPDLVHYGAVFPVSPADLQAFMEPIRSYGGGPDLVLGTAYGPEIHGAGLLRLLLDHWKPGSRRARLDDRYRFAGDGRVLSLGQLYRACRQQTFLPIPGTRPDEAGAALPETPQLPRIWLRFQAPFGAATPIELDAYKLLGLLIELEPDPSRLWRNRFGQPLSLDLLMRHVRGHYRASGPWRREPEDHSNLHLVELLVAYEAAVGGGDLAAVQQHFLATEVAQEVFDPGEAGLLVSHHVESLGHLLGASGLRWSDDQRSEVRRWLADTVNAAFRDLEEEPLNRIAHLVAGLRRIRAHREKLE